ncbi:SHOCT domain-containing protein [Halostella salina]|uniref:SHOCT domain-containing protein n=1 Tax=Halostella salina TaxID=1547897 RepID=UPI000EF814CB|nr:SHOCT domain-containing protein [Halostella salina]
MDDLADLAVLAVSMVAALFGVTLVGAGEVTGLAALLVGVLGFAYLKVDLDAVGATDDAGEQAAAEDDPLTVLRDRYARGEIGRDEFERRLDDLLETDPVERERDRDEEPLLEDR